MKNGGTMIFDTRDALIARPGGPPTAEALWLRGLLKGVDVPELEPVPHDHVLTKTFYLLDRIVGRTAIGQTWVEPLPPPDPNDHAQRPARAGDSVSPIIIASDDLAAAWAEDADRRPLYPLIPGGARQRNLRYAAASIWSCIRSLATTKQIRSTLRTFWKGSLVERLVDRPFSLPTMAGNLRAGGSGPSHLSRTRLARRSWRMAARAEHGPPVGCPL